MHVGIRGRSVIAICAVIVVFVATSLGINYRLMKREAIAVKNAEHEAELDRYLQRIDAFTDFQTEKAEALARMGEWVHAQERDHPEIDSAQAAMSVALALASSNSSNAMLGCGLWYEPYALEESRRWVGPYAVVDGPGRAKPNWEYSNDEYGYIDHAWYTIAVPRGWDRRRPRAESLFMTEPYMDSLEGRPTLFVTFTDVMYDREGRIIGVATADWTLDSLEEALRHFRVTPGSFAFLVHGPSRKVLFPMERNELGRLSDMPWGAHMDPEGTEVGVVSRGHGLPIDGRSYDLLYTRTRAGFVFGLAIDTDEAFSFLDKIATQNILVALATVLFLGLAAFWVVSRLLRPVRDLARSARVISNGDLDHRATVETRDEIGDLARAFNEATDRLRAGEARFRALIENASDVILLMSPERTIRYASPSTRRILGADPEKVVGRSLLDSVHADDVETARRALDSVMSGGTGIESSEVRVRHASGGYRVLEVVGARFDLPGAGTCVVVNARDITERKGAEEALRASEEQLRQAQKLEAIGRLAGGVAHDFNNAMTAVLGLTDLLLLRHKGDPDLASKLGEIRRAGEHAASLTRQLLTMSRKHVSEKAHIDVNTVVRGIERMMARVIGEDVELVTRVEAGLPTVFADPSNLEQVLVNLAVNARDAMPGGGRLTVETRLERLAEPTVSVIGPAPAGAYVAIDVCDTGFGIPREIIDKIFEPFFTTKGTDAGTGLGLSTVYGIVKELGGHIFVESVQGRGSRFSVLIPPREGRVDSREAGQDTLAVGRKEVVLVVEDERLVRETTMEVLRTAGFRPIEASSAAEALELLDGGAAIDLVVTDVVMPQMSGADLAAAVARSRPDLPVLFVSGYSAGELSAAASVAPGRAFLQKPFTPSRLVQMVRNLLDARPLGERADHLLH